MILKSFSHWHPMNPTPVSFSFLASHESDPGAHEISKLDEISTGMTKLQDEAVMCER
jgi:hypothetical protein